MNTEIVQKIKDVDINSEMKKSYIEYAMSVIVSRALPDVRDGLKPVQRRILYAMGELGLTKESKYRKCAKIVGEVMANYHPHGDSSIYGALVRMAQPFSMRYTLIDGQGNFGSIDGDGAAAMRYTEAKMDRLSAELLKDIKKNTVDFQPNFDNEDVEPLVLPSKFPNLLVNGSGGIAVGMATNMPPHNLAEVIDALVALIENPEIEIDEILKYIKGPDFPTGATIMGMSGFRKGYKTGRGSVVIRSKYHIEEQSGGKNSIVVTEIPYQINKVRLLKSIADLVKNKKVEGITGIRDESNREGIRIVIDLRRDVTPQILVNQLFKYTQLQSTFSMNMIALVGGQPKLLNLKEILYYYLEHQKDVETRRVKFDLKKAQDRAHILEGYRIAIDNIDEVIKVIRSAYDDAIVRLMERFSLSEIQAKAIGDMRIIRLQGLEREKIEEEYSKLLVLIEELKGILADESKLIEVIKNDLLTIKQKNYDERKTDIEFDYEEIDMEDLIDDEEVTITLTNDGYVKRISTQVYTVQNRGGRGKSALSTKEEDYVVDIFNCNTHDSLMIFTDYGKVYSIKAYEIPDASRISKGTAIINLIPITQDEKVKTVIAVREFENSYLILQTKNGLFKKTDVGEFKNIRKNGIIAINLKENDELIGACMTSGEDDILVVTKFAQAIRFTEKEIRALGRNTSGVKSIKLREGDEVISICKISGEMMKNNIHHDLCLLSISENGYGKRSVLSEYAVQNRGGIGNKTYKISEKTGNLIGAMIVAPQEDIILINSQGIVIRISVSEISVLSRISMGVKLMKLDESSNIISFTRVLNAEENNSQSLEIDEQMREI